MKRINESTKITEIKRMVKLPTKENIKIPAKVMKDLDEIKKNNKKRREMLDSISE